MNHDSSSSGLICLVDDNADDVLIAQTLLKRAGLQHPVVTFTRSTEALRFLETRSACRDDRQAPLARAVVLDGNMPELDGFELLAKLRELPGLADVPLIMLSGSARTGDRARALRAGATGYFEKFPTAAALAGAITRPAPTAHE